MGIVSQRVAKSRAEYFMRDIPKSAAILEIGSGSGWVGDYVKQKGWNNYTGIDLFPPADIVGDILQWKELGLQPESFDVILAFEVVEHVDCFKVCHDLLKPGGQLMVTTPIPCMDWALKILEATGITQRRTSPHDHLVNLRDVEIFRKKEIRNVACLGQWGKLTKEIAAS